jgi:hypothetical protein
MNKGREAEMNIYRVYTVFLFSLFFCRYKMYSHTDTIGISFESNIIIIKLLTYRVSIPYARLKRIRNKGSSIDSDSTWHKIAHANRASHTYKRIKFICSCFPTMKELHAL